MFRHPSFNPQEDLYTQFYGISFTHPCMKEMPYKTKLNSVALVRERTIPTERPPPVGEVSANFCG